MLTRTTRVAVSAAVALGIAASVGTMWPGATTRHQDVKQVHTAASIVDLTVRACAGPTVTPPTTPQANADTVAIDTTASTASLAVHRSYRLASLSIVDQAAQEHDELRIIAFGASGVGATVIFEGSFAPASADEVFNLAAQNRLKCEARRAVDAAVAIAPSPIGGTDVAGILSSEITADRAIVKPGGLVTVTLLTDGCQAPASHGPNRKLTALCGLLAKGKTVASILRAHPAEFRLPNATGVTVVMLGVGVGRNPAAANTLLAGKLVGFWRTVCRRAHSAACRIGSSVL